MRLIARTDAIWCRAERAGAVRRARTTATLGSLQLNSGKSSPSSRTGRQTSPPLEGGLVEDSGEQPYQFRRDADAQGCSESAVETSGAAMVDGR
jgi:hypothetical protein